MSSATNKSQATSLGDGEEQYTSTFDLERSTLTGRFKVVKSPSSMTCQNELHAGHHKAQLAEFCSALRGRNITMVEQLKTASNAVASEQSTGSTKLTATNQFFDSLSGDENHLPIAQLTLHVTDTMSDADLRHKYHSTSIRDVARGLGRTIRHAKKPDGK